MQGTVKHKTGKYSETYNLDGEDKLRIRLRIEIPKFKTEVGKINNANTYIQREEDYLSMTNGAFKREYAVDGDSITCVYEYCSLAIYLGVCRRIVKAYKDGGDIQLDNSRISV